MGRVPGGRLVGIFGRLKLDMEFEGWGVVDFPNLACLIE
jgi:hypothetical protein